MRLDSTKVLWMSSGVTKTATLASKYPSALAFSSRDPLSRIVLTTARDPLGRSLVACCLRVGLGRGRSVCSVEAKFPVVLGTVNILQESLHRNHCTEIIAQEELHRNYCTGTIAQESLHRNN